mgnify:CR=1 FL=1
MYWYARAPKMEDGKIVATWDADTQSWVPFVGLTSVEQDIVRAKWEATVSPVSDKDMFKTLGVELEKKRQDVLAMRENQIDPLEIARRDSFKFDGTGPYEVHKAKLETTITQYSDEELIVRTKDYPGHKRIRISDEPSMSDPLPILTFRDTTDEEKARLAVLTKPGAVMHVDGCIVTRVPREQCAEKYGDDPWPVEAKPEPDVMSKTRKMFR